VQRKANKVQIKKAVESFYGVNIERVRTMIVPAKRSIKYTKRGVVEGRKSAYKKAIVEVRSGEVIDLYGNI
jgi:large subunit ribosomal protein L23